MASTMAVTQLTTHSTIVSKALPSATALDKREGWQYIPRNLVAPTPHDTCQAVVGGGLGLQLGTPSTPPPRAPSPSRPAVPVETLFVGAVWGPSGAVQTCPHGLAVQRRPRGCGTCAGCGEGRGGGAGLPMHSEDTSR